MNNILIDKINTFLNVQKYYNTNDKSYEYFKSYLKVNNIKYPLMILFDVNHICKLKIYRDIEKLYINLLYEEIFKKYFKIDNLNYKNGIFM